MMLCFLRFKSGFFVLFSASVLRFTQSERKEGSIQYSSENFSRKESLKRPESHWLAEGFDALRLELATTAPS